MAEPRKTRKAKKPEKVIGAVSKAGKVQINKGRLAAFMKQLEYMGITSPKIQFVARNAPFMRQPPIPTV
jgi:hypothetical protein